MDTTARAGVIYIEHEQEIVTVSFGFEGSDEDQASCASAIEALLTSMLLS